MEVHTHLPGVGVPSGLWPQSCSGGGFTGVQRSPWGESACVAEVLLVGSSGTRCPQCPLLQLPERRVLAGGRGRDTVAEEGATASLALLPDLACQGLGLSAWLGSGPRAEGSSS